MKKLFYIKLSSYIYTIIKKKDIKMKLATNTEGQLKNSHNEIFNFRIYKDGEVKVESCNSVEFFETVGQLESYIKTNNLSITEIN